MGSDRRNKWLRSQFWPLNHRRNTRNPSGNPWLFSDFLWFSSDFPLILHWFSYVKYEIIVFRWTKGVRKCDFLLFCTNSRIIRHTYGHDWGLEIQCTQRKQLLQTSFACCCRLPTQNFQTANIDPKSECLNFTEGFPFDFPYVLIFLWFCKQNVRSWILRWGGMELK